MTKILRNGLIIAMLILALVSIRFCGRHSVPVEPSPVPVVAVSSPPIVVEPVKPSVPTVVPQIRTTPVPPVKKPAPPVEELAPPKVQIHPELIPKDISIVRVYYASMISGPASTISFDINGSGFTKEFEQMITVESGNAEVKVEGLRLVTANQIHGTLKISESCKTGISFPRVLIQGKVVFQAPEPFAAIRPGEVLNLVFTEMEETGRSGRFRIYTNLTDEMYAHFKVAVSTPTIMVRDLRPQLPFVVDGSVLIGPAVEGDYGMNVLLSGKNIWSRNGIIRVVKPNVGQSGLIQKIIPLDGFHRPGDSIHFVIQGSGFRPEDANLLSVSSKYLTIETSSFTYVAPGRLDLTITLPKTVLIGRYDLNLKNGDQILHEAADVFGIVPEKWLRVIVLDPELHSGGSASLKLVGRDFNDAFAQSLQVKVDDDNLKIGTFKLVSKTEIVAPIEAGVVIKPGDYLLHLSENGKPVKAQFGNIIRVGTN